MKKIWCILITLINLMLLGGVLWVLFKKPEAQFTGNNITTMLGIIVSCISIVITILFVVFAINAYGKIREIDKNAELAEESANTAKNKVVEIEKKRNSIVQFSGQIGSVAESCFEGILESIETLSKLGLNTEKDKKRRNEVKKNLYRTSLYPYFLKDEVRERYMLNLSVFGNKYDIEQLDKICKSDEESQKIKDTAKFVLEELKRKYP